MREFKAGTETETTQKCCYWVTDWLLLSLLSYSPDPRSFVEMLLSRVTSCINHQSRHFLTDLARGQSSLASSSVEVLFPGDFRFVKLTVETLTQK